MAEMIKKRVKEECFGNQASSSKKREIPTSFSPFNRVCTINTSIHKCPHIEVHVLSEEIEGLANTGASLSIISSVGLIHKLGLQMIPTALKISTADGTPY